MVTKARARVARHGWDNVTVNEDDATTLDLASGGFDAVLASFSISATQNVPATVDWTGVEVLDTVRARFGEAELVNAEGKRLTRLPPAAPVVLIVAEKHPA